MNIAPKGSINIVEMAIALIITVTAEMVIALIMKLKNNIYGITDKQVYNKIMELIEKTSNNKEIIEMCGHAMYIGKKIIKERVDENEIL